MERVTADDVLIIMDNCTLSSDVVDVYILAANRLVTSVFSNETSVTDETLREIERWFTAHMIASVSEKPTIEEKLGEAMVRYSDKPFGLGLDSTPYGQMVKQLDPTGLMASSGKRAATIYAVKSFKK